MGHSELAWKIFYELMDKQNFKQVWFSASIGHKIEGVSLDDIEKWTNQERMKSVKDDDNSLSARYLAQYNIIDRNPPRMLPEKILKLDAHTTPYQFVELYTNFHHKEYGKIRQPRPNSPYELDSHDLPYSVYAWVKLNRMTQLKRIFDYEAKNKGFYDHLSHAILLSVEGKHADAIDSLKAAINSVPFANRGLISTPYVFTVFCEKLYLDTGVDQYRNILLDWVKKLEIMSPTQAWPYAIEAKYTDDRERRIRALGIALYLDKNSAHVEQFSEKEKDEAIKWFEGHNPFKEKGTMMRFDRITQPS